MLLKLIWNGKKLPRTIGSTDEPPTAHINDRGLKASPLRSRTSSPHACHFYSCNVKSQGTPNSHNYPGKEEQS